MKLIITLAESSNRNAISRVCRICRDYHVRIEAPVWSDNNLCEMRLHTAELSEDLFSELCAVCEDSSVTDAFIKAA